MAQAYDKFKRLKTIPGITPFGRIVPGTPGGSPTPGVGTGTGGGALPDPNDPTQITRGTLPGLYGPGYTSPGQAPNEETLAFYQNLMRPVDTNPYIKDLPQNYLDTIKGAPMAGEGTFQDYIKNIGAPSGVDEAKKAAETEQLQMMLKDIGRQTEGSVASSKMDFLDRGMGGPGQMSDIEAIGLAQTRGSGEEAMNRARLTAYQSELDRQKAKEEALRGAYGTRYGAGVASDTQMRDTIASLVGKQPELMAGQIGEQTKRDVALATLLQQMEAERLARAAGKYMQSNSGGGGGGGIGFNIGF